MAKSKIKLRKNFKSKVRKMRTNATKMYKSEILTRQRGIINKRVHLEAYDYIVKHINDFKFYVAIGHGTHTNRTQPPVKVPKNVWLVYTTRPGYWGNMNDALDQKFLNLLTDENAMRRLITGSLANSNIPDVVRHRQWNWKNHVYPPDSYTADHSLELFDYKTNHAQNQTSIWTRYHNVSGVYNVPAANVNDAHFRGSRMTVGQIMDHAKNASHNRPSIVIISGCRGDPVTYNAMMTLQKTRTPDQRMWLNLPQTYPIPRAGSYIQRIENYERNLHKKIIFNENAVKKNIMKLRVTARGPSKRNITAIKRQYKNFFANKNANAYIRNVLRPMIKTKRLQMFKTAVKQVIKNKVNSEIHALPSSSTGYPAKANIDKLARKYPDFFKNKNTVAYVKVTRNKAKRLQTLQRFKTITKQVMTQMVRNKAKRLQTLQKFQTAAKQVMAQTKRKQSLRKTFQKVVSNAVASKKLANEIVGRRRRRKIFLGGSPVRPPPPHLLPRIPYA